MDEELKTNNMSKPFKMKGWSGHQNPSPVRKDWKEAVEDFKKVKKDLESKIQAIGSGDMAKKIKEDLQGLQKEISQKLGKKTKADSRDVSTDQLAKEIKDTSDLTKEQKESLGLLESTVAPKPGDLVETNPWTSGTGDDPWEYRKTDKGYQTRDTRKGKNAPEIDVTDPKSEAYQKIGEKIFDIESDIESDYEIPEWIKKAGRGVIGAATGGLSEGILAAKRYRDTP